jgi:hypothetical protein
MRLYISNREESGSPCSIGYTKLRAGYGTGIGSIEISEHELLTLFHWQVVLQSGMPLGRNLVKS